MSRISERWATFEHAHPTPAQLIIFAGLNIGITMLQLIMMPVFKWVFGMTELIDTGFRAFPVGSGYHIFDYVAGALPEGGGGGLAYFLAVQATLAIAQVINFFAQRNITFRSNTNPWWAALWYTLAYVIITFGAAALQGFYKAPVYELLITTWGMGAAGEAIADVATMLINALLSCAVFFPIFKLIFRRTDTDAAETESIRLTA